MKKNFVLFIFMLINIISFKTDASGGRSKKWKYDCGKPKKGWLKKLAWSGVKSKWPCAYSIIKNFNLANYLIASADALVDADKLSYEKAALKWIDKNKIHWKKWTPSSCEK